MHLVKLFKYQTAVEGKECKSKYVITRTRSCVWWIDTCLIKCWDSCTTLQR